MAEHRRTRLHDQVEGKIGIGGTTFPGFAPSHPLHHANGAPLTPGGGWQNASSRTAKHDNPPLDAKAAFAPLAAHLGAQPPPA